MVLRLSNVPKIGAALAFGLIATGIAVSESQVWDTSTPALSPPVQTYGPPAPASLAEGGPSDGPVNLADGDGGSAAVDNEPAEPVQTLEFGEVPDIVPPPFTMREPELASAPEADDQVTEVAEEPAAVADPVRVIELPRRDDDLDELGRPAEEPDDYQLAALPADETAAAAAEGTPAVIDEELVAPIPAPAYRRPVASYLDDDDFAEPYIVDDDFAAPRPVEDNYAAPRRVVVQRDPATTFGLDSYDVHYVDDSWPRRLDRADAAQGQPYVVERAAPQNLFQTDWVEIRQGGARRVVAQ